MNTQRLNRDLKILIALYDRSGQRNVCWDRRRIEIARVPMPAHIVSVHNPRQRTCCVSIPLPVNLYEAAHAGHYYFYNNLRVEAGLRWQRAGGLYAIPRMTCYEKSGERFTWVCLRMPYCGPKTTIETLVREFQRFLARPS